MNDANEFRGPAALNESAGWSAAGFPVATTQRLVLRQFTVEDADAVFGVFSCEEVARTHNIGPMRSREEARQLLASRMRLWPDGTGIRWAIAFKGEPDRAIGSCGFDFERRAHGAIELGYDLHRLQWGAGLAREAVQAVIALAFEEHLPVKPLRIEAFTLPANRRSRLLLTSLGFTREGLMRMYRQWKSAPADLESYSLLRAEYADAVARAMPPGDCAR